MWNYSTAMAGTSKGQILLPGEIFFVTILLQQQTQAKDKFFYQVIFFGFPIPRVIATRPLQSHETLNPKP